MKQNEIEYVKAARAEGYTWGQISIFMSIPESTIRYYVGSKSKPLLPIEEWQGSKNYKRTGNVNEEGAKFKIKESFEDY
jgi:hypothetical protein